MDTISRENTSYLPVAGVIVGVLALVLAAVALFKVSATGKTVTEHTDRIARVEGMEEQVRGAVSSSDKTAASLASLRREISEAMNAASVEIGNVRGEVTKLQEAAKARPVAAAAAGAKAGPVVAGPDEYVVRSGDNGSKIAKSHNVSLADLTAVNPGIDWKKLKIGDKIKLPKK